MVRHLTFILAFTLVLATVSRCRAEEPTKVDKLPTFKALNEWIDFVKRKDFTLLKAADQNGFFFALFRDGSGDFAFCRYKKDQEFQRVVRGEQVAIATPQGKELDDSRRRFISLIRKYRVRMGDEYLDYTWYDGVLYPVVKDVPGKIRVTYKYNAERSADFDEVVGSK